MPISSISFFSTTWASSATSALSGITDNVTLFVKPYFQNVPLTTSTIPINRAWFVAAIAGLTFSIAALMGRYLAVSTTPKSSPPSAPPSPPLPPADDGSASKDASGTTAKETTDPESYKQPFEEDQSHRAEGKTIHPKRVMWHCAQFALGVGVGTLIFTTMTVFSTFQRQIGTVEN